VLAYHRRVTQAQTTTRPGRFIPIPADIRAFIDDTKVATIATTDPDGGPRQAVIWYTVSGDEIVLNSKVGRRWPSNLVRDPRVSFSVIDPADDYRWIGLTGLVTVVEDQATAQADIAGMARRYHADDPEKAERLIHRQFEQQTRISFRVHLLSVTRHFD
jgi:PPOX class probable F420-dependent enzyme